ncbi:MAG: SAM-dependent methyltransferase [Promethearchaeati archaeon SRVP18_Atabeyarchaeia-1]
MGSSVGEKYQSHVLPVIIEHLEPVLGEWIWLEYQHASRMVGDKNITFANVKNKREAHKLREIGKVTHNSVVELRNIIGISLVVLDPQAPVELSPRDFSLDISLVVGGILGDHPARGRTRQSITTKIPESQSRNLGPHQFSVDGAIYVALQVAANRDISEIPVEVGMEVTVSKRHTDLLPFAYPLVEGKPLLTPGLREYLRRGISRDEEVLFRTGRPRSVA